MYKKNKEMWDLAQELSEKTSDQKFMEFINENMIEDINELKTETTTSTIFSLIILIAFCGYFSVFSIFLFLLTISFCILLFFSKNIIEVSLTSTYPFLKRFFDLQKKFEQEEKDKEISELKEKYLKEGNEWIK